MPAWLAAQSAGQPAPQEPAPDQPKKVVTALLTTTPITLDGVLDEAVWKAAVPATDFVQREPRQGEPATDGCQRRADGQVR